MSESTMRAVGVSPARKEIGLIDQQSPRILAANHVKIRTLEVGVCGTDKEICTFVYGAPPEGSEYLVLGHEAIGEIVEVGDEVRGFKRGDLVVPSVRRPCAHPECSPCRAGLQDFCITGDFTERGIKKTHGFMTESFVEEERYLTFVPPELRDVAVLVEPLTVAEKAMAQVWHIQQRLPWTHPGESGQSPGQGLNAVVLGAGPVGILGAMTLKANGFQTFVYSRSKAPNPKAELVESIGAQYISSLETTPEELAERVGNIDLVYEAVGLAPVSFEVLKHLGINGVFVFTGIPGPKPPMETDTAEIMRNMVLKNQVAIGTVNADEEAFRSAIRDLGRFRKLWPETLASLITGRYQIGQYRELLLGERTGIKNVITFD
jgi:threonine dehydrogenase-like Zn-dependent dehydrogenase